MSLPIRYFIRKHQSSIFVQIRKTHSPRLANWIVPHASIRGVHPYIGRCTDCLPSLPPAAAAGKATGVNVTSHSCSFCSLFSHVRSPTIRHVFVSIDPPPLLHERELLTKLAPPPSAPAENQLDITGAITPYLANEYLTFLRRRASDRYAIGYPQPWGPQKDNFRSYERGAYSRLQRVPLLRAQK